MCSHCEVLYINGVKCHETGCPVAYLDGIAECEWCGQSIPSGEGVRQRGGKSFCCDDCYRDYYNIQRENEYENQEEDEIVNLT